MPHLDPDRLSLLALYDEWRDEEGREHLRSCSACSADFAALRRPVDAMKTTPDASILEAPGPQVWAGIHRELGLSQAVQEDPLAVDRDAERPGAAPAGAAPAAEPTQTGEQAQPPEPARLRRRTETAHPLRRSTAGWHRPGTWLAAAAAVLLVAGATVWSLNQTPRPVAQAELTPLAQHSATGTAKVVREPDGSRTLEVKLSKDEAQGYQEVWLIAPDLSRLVSLGVMNTDSGSFQVPAGLELADFPIVDVSDEPVDGNPAHSSVSIVRGTLNI